MDTCFHCGNPVTGYRFERLIGGEARKFCCAGCASAAQLIRELGLEAYYRFRTENADQVAPTQGVFAQFDSADARSTFISSNSGQDTVFLDIQGINCAACAWLIERAIRAVDGVLDVSVNTATGRARILFRPQQTSLSVLLTVIAQLGYRPAPLSASAVRTDRDVELRNHLKRLAVSGFGMMQVMMFAVALYTGEAQGMDAVMRSFMRYVSLVVATPVMMYGGWPFFVAAWSALRSRSLTMDVPVAIGLLLAYGASIFNTVTHRGEVYFDSVTMFIFFLTVARFVEVIARRRCVSLTESLGRLLPTLAHRIGLDGGPRDDVPVSLLLPGDRILVRNGEVIPADAEIESGCSSIDESMLTGESTALSRGPGDRVLAGTVNVGAPITCIVKSVGSSTVLSSIVTLLLRAQADRPTAVRSADLMARKFLLRVLIGAALVFALWHYLDPPRAFDATLAVLIVACPCALSLGPLIALASATSALARQGVLVSHPDAIENLARVTHVVFDKTGTLTAGRMHIASVQTYAGRDENLCRLIAAALEAGSDHPLARAFDVRANPFIATDIKVRPGAGVEGTVNGKHYRLGSRSFAIDPSYESSLDVVGNSAIVLVENDRRIATFEMSDSIRAEARAVVTALQDQHLGTEILSGDALERVTEIARKCGIRDYTARCMPEQKLERVRALDKDGQRVVMVGDGINDAPVLGGASVSVAMGRGSALAHASADLVLVQDSLAALPNAILKARHTQQIIRQNMIWAASYNFLAIPLAALGLVPPWAAAIGMSASSIMVVLNSLRLGAKGPARSPERPMALLSSRAAG